MRIRLAFILVTTSFSVCAQNGYVKLVNDSIRVGYLRYYVSAKDGHQGIELWRTKNDKEPAKIPKTSIREYAIKKDTFKVLQQFKPFEDTNTYFELVSARRKLSGKVNLYVIENYANENRVSNFTGGGLIPAVIDQSMGNFTYLYLLEDDETGFMRALPSKKVKLNEVLMDFFPERYILKYAELKGEIKYKSVEDLIKLYNSK